jgi:hypothetical protein
MGTAEKSWGATRPEHCDPERGLDSLDQLIWDGAELFLEEPNAGGVEFVRVDPQMLLGLRLHGTKGNRAGTVAGIVHHPDGGLSLLVATRWWLRPRAHMVPIRDTRRQTRILQLSQAAGDEIPSRAVNSR